MLLKGKKVLITGGERGIGRQTALSAAQEGADILVVGVLEEEMAVTVRMVQELGVNAYSAKMDITDYEATDRTIKDLAAQSGGIDVLVNNAGIFQEAFFVDMTPAQWRKTISVDLDGVYNVTHAAIPYIIEKKGSVISIASQDAFYGCPGYSHYAACKAALVGLTRTLARELGSTGVRFNCVAPGIIQLSGQTACGPCGPSGGYCQRDHILGFGKSQQHYWAGYPLQRRHVSRIRHRVHEYNGIFPHSIPTPARMKPHY